MLFLFEVRPSRVENQEDTKKKLKKMSMPIIEENLEVPPMKQLNWLNFDGTLFIQFKNTVVKMWQYPALVNHFRHILSTNFCFVACDEQPQISIIYICNIFSAARTLLKKDVSK